MTNNDRDVFESWCNTKFGGLGTHLIRTHGVYRNGSVQAGWVAWQAACDFHAPQLSKEEAATIFIRELKEIAGISLDRLRAEMVVSAMEAAGVHFARKPLSSANDIFTNAEESIRRRPEWLQKKQGDDAL